MTPQLRLRIRRLNVSGFTKRLSSASRRSVIGSMDEGEVLRSRTTESFSDEDSPPASSSEWTLTKDATIALYTKLRRRLSMPRFANQMSSLLEKGPTWDVEEERLKLIREVEQKAILSHNLEATDEGVKLVREACKSWQSDSDVAVLHMAILNDHHIDAFGDNPDIELAQLKNVTAWEDTHETFLILESFRKVLASPKLGKILTDVNIRDRCAMTEKALQSVYEFREIQEGTAKKAAQRTVDLEKQYNSPRAAAVMLCCRG